MPKTSFSQVAIVEAVARLAQVCLVVRPLRSGPEKRLSSRFLGVAPDGNVVLAVPISEGPKGRKVFLPDGCYVGMVFSVGDMLLQAVTRVLGYCHHMQQPGRRVEALTVARPIKVTELSQRKHPRWEIDPAEQMAVSLWPAEILASGAPTTPRTGYAVNCSAEGLGVRLCQALPFPTGTEMILRIESRGPRESLIHRGVLKHCTPMADGQFLAGFGEVVELGPGQAVAIMESLAAPK